MRSCRFAVVLAVAVWALPAPAATAGPTEPTETWVYPYLYELRLRESLGPAFISTAPYGRLETAASFKGFRPGEACERSLWLYNMLETEFRGETRVLEKGSGWTGDMRVEAGARTGSRSHGQAIGRFAYYSPIGIALWTSVRTSVNADNLHKMETKVWGDRGRASVDYAGIAFRKDGFMVSLSRDEVSWGADRRRGLLFSGTAPSFDMVSLGYRGGWLAFTSFHSMLRGGDEDPEEGLRRYVSAHRLEVLPCERLSFGISEAVIYGGRYRSLEPVYMNPFTVFYADQWNSGWNDNILIAGDFALLFPRRAEIRGEIMIDDFQYDFGNEPHEFGAGLSAAAVNPLAPHNSTFEASYFHIRNQTYGHYVPLNRFIHEGSVMGYEDGPDGDRFAIRVNVARPVSMLWQAGYSIRRKGEGRATDVQERTGCRVDFPSGTVETSHLVEIVVAWRPCHMWFLEAGVEYHRENNAGHVEGVDEDGWDLSLGAQFNLNVDSRWRD